MSDLLPLRIIPLGGLGEIGKNMLALEYGDDIVVVDCGVQFPRHDMFGVDLVIPDVSYLKKQRDKVKAILITHGHEDHIGALPYILPDFPVPIYAPQLAAGLISVKLKRNRALKDIVPQVVEPCEPFNIGSFKVEFFRVCHSIPDSMGIALTTPLGTVIHTGDFKIDHTPVDGKTTDISTISRYGSEGVLLLLSDSTYAEIPGYTPSEQVVGESLDKAIGEAHGRVLVASFASLISRIQQVMDAAYKHGRKMVVIGRSMVENVNLAIKIGYLNPGPDLLVTLEECTRLPNDQIVLMTTGSQGEPTSALVRIANRNHREIEIIPGDTVIISASPIPGNETVVAKTIDNLHRQKAKVLHDRVALVHVHGHSSQEELKMMLDLTKPKFFVPIHGDYRHLQAHASLARAVGVPEDGIFVLEDGDVLEITTDGGDVGQSVPSNHVYIDGSETIDDSSMVLEERRTLSKDGIVVVALTCDQTTGVLLQDPKVLEFGFVGAEDSNEVLAKLISSILESEEHILAPTLTVEQRTKNLREFAHKVLYKETRRRPIIIPMVLEV